MFHIHKTPQKGDKYTLRSEYKNPFDRYIYTVTVDHIKDDWIEVVDYLGDYSHMSLTTFYRGYKRDK
jgi:hypothetical protein